jgi:hypothetical protein
MMIMMMIRLLMINRGVERCVDRHVYDLISRADGKENTPQILSPECLIV